MTPQRRRATGDQLRQRAPLVQSRARATPTQILGRIPPQNVGYGWSLEGGGVLELGSLGDCSGGTIRGHCAIGSKSSGLATVFI